MRAANPKSLLPRLMPFLYAAGVPTEDEPLILRCIPLIQPRANSLTEMADQLRPLLTKAPDLAYDAAALAKACTEEARTHVKAVRDRLAALASFDRDALHGCIHGYVEEKSIKFKAVAPALRVSLLGATGGPDLADAMAALGRDESLARLDRALSL